MRPLKVLVACESSGAVRRAFRALGHHAWSCDLLPADDGSPFHIQGDAVEAAYDGYIGSKRWDLMIAHPPCTRITNSGVRWLHSPPKGRTLDDMWGELRDAVRLFNTLAAAPIAHIAIENPIPHKHARALMSDPNYSQVIQPWMFGHGETKATCLWLKNLPLLVPTDIVEGREGRIHKLPPTPDRWKLRSATYAGIAAAMADQWSASILNSPARCPIRLELLGA